MNTETGVAELRAACKQIADGVMRLGDAVAVLAGAQALVNREISVPRGPGRPPKNAAQPAAAKDPNAPKRPPSSFLLFSREKRAEIATVRPGLSFAEQTAALGEEWRKADQKPWEEQANAAMAAYKTALLAYQRGEASNSAPVEAVPAPAGHQTPPTIVVETPAVPVESTPITTSAAEDPNSAKSSPEKKKKKKKSKDGESV